jgi:amidase
MRFKIGVMYGDGVVAPHPPVSRCLRETVQTIEKAGHSTVPWNPSLHNDLVICINQLLSLDNQAEFAEVLSQGHEPPTPLSKTILDKTNPTLLTLQDTWKVKLFFNNSLPFDC